MANDNTHAPPRQADYSLGSELRDGKRDWRGKRCRCELLAESYGRLGKPSKALRVKTCGTMLVFGLEVESMAQKLYFANFCKDRLCPLCTWRRSLKAFAGLSASMTETIRRAGQAGDQVEPIFLTLTVKNCKGCGLRDEIDRLVDAWKRMANSDKFKRLFEWGWFRSLEVTYNRKRNDYHPHIHALLLPTKEYFRGKDYMKHADWVARWRKAARLDYDPSVRIEAATSGEERARAVLELSKYVVKDAEILLEDDQVLTDKVVDTLGEALANRRLYAYGGQLKRVAAELGADKEDGDLIHVDENAIQEDVAVLYLVYHWGVGYRYKLALATADKGEIDALTGMAAAAEKKAAKAAEKVEGRSKK